MHKTILCVILLLSASLLKAERFVAANCFPDFVDGVFLSQMNEHNLAGATFAFIHNGNEVLTRAYGYSNVDALQKTDSNTAFRIGSVSKIFVWVSVMQLVEQNRIDLDRPVNEYLGGFRLPEYYMPVSMRHLMSHTAGFEDNVLNIFSSRREDLTDLETYLTTQLPKQIYKPGTTLAYSNYGVALAAHVVEQVSGMEFNEYIEKNILLPLGMTQTTFRQPANTTITENKSLGFVWRDGKFVTPFDEYILPYAAGSAVSSANDILRLMKALLAPDTVGSARILEDQTLSTMFSTLYSPNPKMPGMGYGFFRMEYKGIDIFWHGGNTYFFNTAFALIPEYKMGIFFSTNTGQNKFLYIDVLFLLLDHIFGIDRHIGQHNNRRANDHGQYAGRYLPSRRNESGYTKIFNLFMGVKVEAVSHGLMVTFPGISPTLFRPYDFQGTFVSADNNKLIFEKDSKGNISRAFISHFPAIELHTMTRRETAGFNTLLLILVIFIAIKCLIMPLALLSGKSKQKGHAFRWWMLPCSILILLFFFLFFDRFATLEQALFPNFEGLNIILLMPLGSLVFFIIAIISWFSGQVMANQRLAKTLWQFVAFIILIVFYFQMSFWNLLTLPNI